VPIYKKNCANFWGHPVYRPVFTRQYDPDLSPFDLIFSATIAAAMDCIGLASLAVWRGGSVVRRIIEVAQR